MKEFEENVNALKGIISDFENQTWFKMATTKDMARYIVSRGFYPSKSTTKYQVGISKVINKINDLLDEGDQCGLSCAESLQIVGMLKSIVREKQ